MILDLSTTLKICFVSFRFAKYSKPVVNLFFFNCWLNFQFIQTPRPPDAPKIQCKHENSELVSARGVEGGKMGYFSWYTYMPLPFWGAFSWILVFADRVYVCNHWLLVQALAHSSFQNYDVPLAFVLWLFRSVVRNKQSMKQLTWQWSFSNVRYVSE